jgi:NADPH-dependent F420 reductase
VNESPEKKLLGLRNTSRERARELNTKSIGIIGGTGALGRGLAFRWARAGLPVIIGSRNRKAAEAAAAEVLALVGNTTPVIGEDVEQCAQMADIIVLAVPWDAHNSTVELISSRVIGKILLNVVSPLARGKGGIRALTIEEGSACAAAQNRAQSTRVVGGFHHVSAVKLSDEAATSVDSDVMLVADDLDAIDSVAELVRAIPGMRPIYAGKLAVAAAVEGLTANLIAANRHYKTNAGIRVTGVEE